MKTRFQISMQRGSPALTSEPRVSPAGVRSTCSSEQGPHGPVSPIIQKLSFRFPGTMCSKTFSLENPASRKIRTQRWADSRSGISMVLGSSGILSDHSKTPALLNAPLIIDRRKLGQVGLLDSGLYTVA